MRTACWTKAFIMEARRMHTDGRLHKKPLSRCGRLPGIVRGQGASIFWIGRHAFVAQRPLLHEAR